MQMKTTLPSVPHVQVPKELRNHWPEMGGKPAVFLAQFAVPAGHALKSGKTPVKVAVFSGIGEGEYGPAIQYTVVEMGGKPPREHHLAQGGRSVAYQTKQERERELQEPRPQPIRKITPEIRELIEMGGDVMMAMRQLTGATNSPHNWGKELLVEYKAAGEPKAKKKWLSARLAPRFTWVSHRPRWTEDEGEWCCIAGKPMVFVGQTAVPDAKDIPDGAPAGEMIYLFFNQTASGQEFKIISQTCGEQTAEDHYRLEEQLARFHELGGAPEAANELVRKGDKWAHRFLLDRADLAKATLQLLAKQGATRQLQEEAKGRLSESGVS
jgi:hypothetical protein